MSYETQIRAYARQIQEAATYAFARAYNEQVEHWARANPRFPEEEAEYIEHHMMRRGDEKWDRVFDDFQYLNEYFSTLADIPDPGPSASIARSMEKITGAGRARADGGDHDITGGMLRDPAMYGYHSMIGKLEEWSGDARDAFEDFAADIPSAIHNQTTLALVLRDTANVHYAVLDAARRSALDLGENAVKAFQSFPIVAGDKAAAKATLVILAAVFAVAAAALAVPTAGASAAGAAAAFAVVAAATGAASDFVPDEDEAPQLQLYANSVDGIAANVFEAIHSIRVGLTGKEDDLADQVLNPNLTVVRDHRHFLVADRPWDLVESTAEGVRDRDRLQPPPADH